MPEPKRGPVLDKSGQATPPAAQGGQGLPAPFHSWKTPQGEEVRFMSPDELNTYLRQNTLRHGDYTKKTQELGTLRGKLATREQELNQREQQIQQLAAKYQQFQTFLDSRPDVVQQIEAAMGPPQGQGGLMPANNPQGLQQMVSEAIQEALAPLTQRMDALEQTGATSEAQEAALRALSEQYGESFDSNAVTEYLREMSEAPDDDNMRTLAEMAHFALQGRSAYQASQQQQTRETQSRGVLPTGGGATAPPDSGEKTFGSMREAAEAAKSELGVTTEEE